MMEQYIPEMIGAGVGISAGVSLDYLATKIAGKNSHPLIEEWGIQTEKNHSLRDKIKRINPLIAIALGATGIFCVEAISAHQTNIITPAALEIVVDHSGATRYPYEGQAATLTEIDKLVLDLNSDTQISSEAFVGSAGGVIQMSPSDIEIKAVTKQVAGDSVLDVGFNQALQSTATSKTDKKRNQAIVVITNGNAIGDPSTFVTSLKKQDKTPIYVVNVEDVKNADPANLTEFTQIGNIAGGNHWNANSKNLATITKEVEKNLKPEITPEKSSSNLALDILGASVLGLLAEEIFRLRSRNVLQSNIEGE